MVDILIVSLYLVFILFAGLITSKNINSIKDFAISERSHSNLVMVATISATWIGGGTIIGLTEKVYSSGIIFCIIFLGDFFCKILNAYFIAPKIGNFYGSISTGDIMEKAYGKNAKIITGICGVLLSLGVISTQITAIGYFLGNFLHISKLIAILIGFGIIIVYATSGGVKSVTYTDLIQFITMFLGIPLILFFSIMHIGGIESFLKNIPASKLQLNYPGQNIQHLVHLLLFSFAISSPVFTQRLLMSRSPKQAIKAMNITALMDIPFYITISLIALAGWIINKEIVPTNVLAYLIENVLPIGIKGLAIATILAAIMSTADSFLNAAAVCLAQDIIKPLSHNKLSEENLLKLARMATLVLGIISVIIGYYADSVYRLLLYSRISWQPFIMVPFIAVIIGLDVKKFSFYIGLISSLIAIILWEYYELNETTKVHSILVGSFVNLMFFTLSHYKLRHKNTLLTKL